MKILLLILALFTTAASATGCPQHYLDGMQPATPVSRELCYSEFAVGYSDDKRSVIYVVEHITKDELIAAGALFKAVYVPATSQATVYVSDNGFLGTYHTITVADLQMLTGFNVFPSLPAAQND